MVDVVYMPDANNYFHLSMAKYNCRNKFPERKVRLPAAAPTFLLQLTTSYSLTASSKTADHRFLIVFVSTLYAMKPCKRMRQHV